ncbi:MAG: hypothetical protein PHI88_02150 [Candidatus Pacebacteria bacterium]|nr:hypothetical protein [Candidatus Paceibacterota bacterium]
MRQKVHRTRIAGNKRKLYFEIRRKFVHLVFGATIAFLIYKDLFFLPFWVGILFLGLIFSYLSKKGEKISFISDFIFSFEREKEIKEAPLKGALLFLLGCILSYIIFEPQIAIAAIVTLFLGDTIVALFGLSFGKFKSPTNPKKHIDATLVGVFVNTIIISFLFSFSPCKILFASTISLFSESLIPFNKLENSFFKIVFDDNILIPLIFGLTLFFLA